MNHDPYEQYQLRQAIPRPEPQPEAGGDDVALDIIGVIADTIFANSVLNDDSCKRLAQHIATALLKNIQAKSPDTSDFLEAHYVYRDAVMTGEVNRLATQLASQQRELDVLSKERRSLFNILARPTIKRFVEGIVIAGTGTGACPYCGCEPRNDHDEACVVLDAIWAETELRKAAGGEQ